MDLNEFLDITNKIKEECCQLTEDDSTKQINILEKQIDLLVFLKCETLDDIQKLIDEDAILPDTLYQYFITSLAKIDNYYDSDFYTMNRLLMLDVEDKLPLITVHMENKHLLSEVYIKMLDYTLNDNSIDTIDKKTYFTNIETYCIKKHIWENKVKTIQQLKTKLAQELAEKYLNLIETEFDDYSVEDFEDWLEEVFEIDQDNKTVLELKAKVEQIKLNEQEEDLEKNFLPDSSIKIRPIYEIANDISEIWTDIRISAKPYLDAMFSLETLDDFYGQDSAYGIVCYFLSYANGNLSPEVKALKYELMNLVKIYEINHNL